MSNEVLNPVDIEHAIRECSDRIHKGVSVVSNLEAVARKARRDYDAAYARAYMSHKGPAHEKRYGATLETTAELEKADEAEVAFKYAERQARALAEELRSWQSVGASVRMMYGAQR
jgi:hypothetical protein